MPQGDAQRSWFPEMLEDLAEKWNPSLSWDECAELCKRMTKRRSAIRKKKGITGPRILCKGCGDLHDMEPLPIGVRSLLFALKKQGLLNDEELALKDKEWKRHQRKYRLDSLGNQVQVKERSATDCL